MSGLARCWNSDGVSLRAVPAQSSDIPYGYPRRHPPRTVAWWCVEGAGPAAVGQRTLPYQTLLDQIFSRRTTVPLLGACQMRLLPA